MHNFLKILGTNDKETKAFIKMLELGPKPISQIAKHIGVPRSSTYVLIDRLKSLGLVETYQQHEITYAKPIPAKSLVDYLDAKQRKIAQAQEELKEELPRLEALENNSLVLPKVKLFEGEKGVIRAYEHVLRFDEFYAVFNTDVVAKYMPQYVNYLAEKIGKDGRAKEILIDSPSSRAYKERFESKTHQIKILPKGAAFEADMILCQDYLYFFAYGDDQISATEITSPSLVQAQRVVFETLWDRL